MSVQVKGSGTIGGLDEGLVVAGISTFQDGIHIDDSITHIGDTNTKIRFPANDTISFETNGAERFHIRSDGKVGIGTDMAGAPASNYGFGFYRATGTGYLYTETGQSGASAGLRAKAGTSDFTIFTTQGVGQLAVYDNTNSAERLRIDSDGRLLIGVDTSGQADANLQVFRPTGTVSRIQVGNVATSASGVAGIDFCPSNKVMGSRIECQASEDFSTTANRTADLVFFTRKDGTSSEKLRIDSSGRVMIGTTDEGWTGYDELTIATSGNTGMTIRSGTSSSGQIAFADGTSGDAEYRGIIRYGHSTDDFFFCTNGDTPRMKVASNIIETGTKTITGGNNLAIQGFAVKGIYSGSPSIGKSIELISGYDSAVKMAAIGYNLTDVNLGSTYGGDLTFHTQPLYGSPTTPIPEVMRLSSSGYITTPKNVVFEVTTNGGQQLTNATVAKVEFNNVVNQRGVSFDTSNYRFTAPVAGYYHFDLFIYTYYTRFVECDSRINGGSTGSKVHRLTTYVNSNDQNPCPVMGSWTQYLAANDYVEQYIYVTTSHGSHRQIYGDTNRKPTWWAGYLVG